MLLADACHESQVAPSNTKQGHAYVQEYKNSSIHVHLQAG